MPPSKDLERSCPSPEAAEGPDFRLDLRVLACVAIASAASVLLFGLAPAFMAVKDAWSSVMTTRSSASASRSFSSIARRVLIGGQIALSVVLLIVSGLFLKSFTHSQNIDLGFNPNHVLLVTINPLASRLFQRASLPLSRTIAAARRRSSRSEIRHRRRARSVSLLGIVGSLHRRLYRPRRRKISRHRAPTRWIRNYFATMQIPLLYGREFTSQRHQRNLPASPS